MKTKLKKILAAVLVLSSLAGFSMGVASYESFRFVPVGCFPFGYEDYIVYFENTGRDLYPDQESKEYFQVIVNNKTLAEALKLVLPELDLPELDLSGDENITGYLLEEKFWITKIELENDISNVFIPETLFNKQVEFSDEIVITYKDKVERELFMSKRLRESLIEILIKRKNRVTE